MDESNGKMEGVHKNDKLKCEKQKHYTRYLKPSSINEVSHMFDKPTSFRKEDFRMP